MKISNWRFLSLARKNHLSLELRHQWSRKTGWDPVNIAREDLVSRMGLRLLFLGIALFVVSAAMNAVPLSAWTAMGAILLLVFAVMVMFWSGQASPSKAQGFNEAYASFLEWTNATSASLVKFDLPELRALAQGILVPVAKEVLQFQEGFTNDPERNRNADNMTQWQRHVADLHNKYDVLFDLGLAYGGLDHFYAVAQKELTAEAALAPVAEAPAPAEAPVP